MKPTAFIPRSFFVVLLASFALQASAQTSRFEAAACAGPSLSWLRGNKAIDNTDALLAVAGGLSLQVQFSEKIGLRLGAAYQQKGSRTEVLFTDPNGNALANGKVRSALNYLMLPLMVRTSFGGGARFSVGVGPYAGYLIRARQSWEGDVIDEGSDDNTGDFERLDMGISLGFGASWSLGENLWLNAEARYDKGLTNISAFPMINDGSIRTHAVSLLVGCSYRFGKAL